MENTIREKVMKFVGGTMIDLVKSYESHDLRASGNWPKELEAIVDETPTGMNVKILGAHYTKYMEYGRPKSKKFPPIDIIRKWIDDKGIVPYDNITKNSLAFLIARKIAREGYKPRLPVMEVINDKWLEDFLREVGALITVEFTSEMIAEMKGEGSKTGNILIKR